MDREGGRPVSSRLGLVLVCLGSGRRFCAILQVTSVEQIPKRTLFLDLPDNIIVIVIVC